MPHHEQLLSDPLGTMRGIWDDTGWRFTLIAALLIFLFETFMDVGNGSTGAGSVGWTAVIVSLLLIARALTLRPLTGEMSAAENRVLLLSIVMVLLAEVAVTWTSVGGTFAGQPIFWPFSVMFALVLIAARLIAPRLDSPLDQWVIGFWLVNFWLQAAMWAGKVVPPDGAFSWAIMLTGVALILRWFVGRGFHGPIMQPLNIAAVLFIFLLWWLEYGATLSGASAVWVRQELYWPWLLWVSGLALGVRLVAPHIVQHFSSD